MMCEFLVRRQSFSRSTWNHDVEVWPYYSESLLEKAFQPVHVQSNFSNRREGALLA